MKKSPSSDTTDNSSYTSFRDLTRSASGPLFYSPKREKPDNSISHSKFITSAKPHKTSKILRDLFVNQYKNENKEENNNNKEKISLEIPLEHIFHLDKDAMCALHPLTQKEGESLKKAAESFKQHFNKAIPVEEINTIFKNTEVIKQYRMDGRRSKIIQNFSISNQNDETQFDLANPYLYHKNEILGKNHICRRQQKGNGGVHFTGGNLIGKLFFIFPKISCPGISTNYFPITKEISNTELGTFEYYDIQQILLDAARDTSETALPTIEDQPTIVFNTKTIAKLDEAQQTVTETITLDFYLNPDADPFTISNILWGFHAQTTDTLATEIQKLFKFNQNISFIEELDKLDDQAIQNHYDKLSPLYQRFVLEFISPLARDYHSDKPYTLARALKERKILKPYLDNNALKITRQQLANGSKPYIELFVNFKKIPKNKLEEIFSLLIEHKYAQATCELEGNNSTPLNFPILNPCSNGIINSQKLWIHHDKSNNFLQKQLQNNLNFLYNDISFIAKIDTLSDEEIKTKYSQLSETYKRFILEYISPLAMDYHSFKDYTLEKALEERKHLRTHLKNGGLQIQRMEFISNEIPYLWASIDLNKIPKNEHEIIFSFLTDHKCQKLSISNASSIHQSHIDLLLKKSHTPNLIFENCTFSDNFFSLENSKFANLKSIKIIKSNIKNLNLKYPLLNSVYLIDCKQITGLTIQSSNLKNLSLQGCNNLKEFILLPTNDKETIYLNLLEVKATPFNENFFSDLVKKIKIAKIVLPNSISDWELKSKYLWLIGEGSASELRSTPLENINKIYTQQKPFAVKFSEMPLTDKEIFQLLKAASGNPHCHTLDLSSQKIEDKLVFIKETLTFNKKITSLILISTNINKKLPNLSKAIIGSGITKLNISNNHLTDADTQNIIELVKQNLSELTLSKNNISITSLNKIIKEQRQLQKLVISEMNFGDNDTNEIKDLLKNNPNIIELDLSNNNLSTKSIAEITQTAILNPNFIHINFTGNPLYDREFSNLINKNLLKDRKDNKIFQKDIVNSNFTILPTELNNILEGQLKNLDISEMNFDDNDINRIKDLLKNNPNILELDLSNNNLSTESIAEITQIAILNTKLTHINFTGNGLSDSEFSKLINKNLLTNSQDKKIFPKEIFNSKLTILPMELNNILEGILPEAKYFYNKIFCIAKTGKYKNTTFDNNLEELEHLKEILNVVDLLAQDEDGNTILHLAILSKNTWIANVIIETMKSLKLSFKTTNLNGDPIRKLAEDNGLNSICYALDLTDNLLSDQPNSLWNSNSNTQTISTNPSDENSNKTTTSAFDLAQ